MGGRPQFVNWNNPQIIETLSRLFFVEEKSASQIAMAMGIPSRNAIIGKLHRLGWKRDYAVGKHNRGLANSRRAAARRGIDQALIVRERPKPAPKASRPRKARTAHPWRNASDQAAIERPSLNIVGAGGALPSRMDLNMPADAAPVAYYLRDRTACAWPIGPAEEPGHSEMMVCGAPAEEGRPYCACHARSAWNGKSLKKLSIVEPTVVELPKVRRAA